MYFPHGFLSRFQYDLMSDYEGETTFLFASGFVQGFASAVDMGGTLLACDGPDAARGTNMIRRRET